MQRELSLVLTVAVAACGVLSGVHSNEPRPEDFLAAVTRGDAAEVRALLDRGADVNARNDNGDSALMLAVLYGDADLVKLLLDRKADPKHANEAGATALHWAMDNPAEVEALLAAGADPNAITTWGYTPLMAAVVRQDSAAVVPILLEHGADPNRTSGHSMRAVILAGGGDTRSLQALLDHGADARAKTNAGFSALHSAANKGNVDNVRLLLSRGADANSPDAEKRTPLMWAAQMGSTEVVTTLLAHGADANGKEEFSGTTALMQAASSDRADPAIVSALLEAGADVRPVDDEGLSALMWATRRGDKRAVRAIGASGAGPLLKPAGRRLGPSNTVKAAIARAIPLLERAGPAFRVTSKCPSCHHDALPAMALARAKGRGFAIDEKARVAEARFTVEALRPDRERYLIGSGFADILEPAYFLPGVEAGGYARDDMTDAMTRYLALRQTHDGGWRAQMQRIPLDGSDVSLTALAVRSLRLYAPPSRAADTDSRVARARAYLAQFDASTNEDLTYKALGLRWAGASKADIAPTITKLVARQRADGGFAQLDTLASDAYATGQAIVALRDAGDLAEDDLVIRRAKDFLLADQIADGTWFVATRALPFQPFFNSGFPHGRSQYISAAATAWAVLALASVGD